MIAAPAACAPRRRRPNSLCAIAPATGWKPRSASRSARMSSTRGWFRARSRPVPASDGRPARRRHGLSARAHAVRLRRGAAAAKWRCRALRPRRRFRNRRCARLCVEPASAFHAPPSHPIRRKGRPSISPKKPITTTRRRGSPASSACSSIAGYDAYPIDGVQGAKTQSRHREIHQRPQARRPMPRRGEKFFDVLMEAAGNPEGAVSPGATTPAIR